MNVMNGTEDAAVTAMIGLFEWNKSAGDATATAATAETAIAVMGNGAAGFNTVALGSIVFHPGASVPIGSGNTCAVLNVFKRTPGTASATAASGILLASLSTGTTALPIAFGPVGFSLVSGAFISAGDAITTTITKTGAGATIPQGFICGYPTVT